MRARHSSVRRFDVAIVLHNREYRGWLIDANDRATAFPVVPTNIQLIEIAICRILSRNDALIRVALKEELSADIVAILVQIDSSDYWCGEADGENALAVWLTIKGDWYTR